MTDTIKISNSKATRGRQFPALSLPEAVKIIKKAGSFSRSLSVSALATYAGHTTDKSGPFRTKVASLRDWGLITGPKDDVFTLTERAMAIALPQSDESEQAALKEAFLGFGLFSDMYELVAKGVENERVNLANTAVHKLKISVQGKDKFVKSFIASAVLVGLAELVGRDKVIIIKQQTNQDNLAQPIHDEAVPFGQDPNRQDSDGRRYSTPVMQQIWEFENGTVTLSIDSSSALSLDVFRELPSVIESIEKLVVVLGPKIGQ